MLAYSLRGAAPAGPADGVVLADENCEPDRNGISHCLNSVRLDAGGTLTVRHDHAMHDDPCLSPGERVRSCRSPPTCAPEPGAQRPGGRSTAN